MSFDVDLTLRRGERVIACRFASDAGATVLVGPSGAGKTSVLHAIAGLLRPAAGQIRVGGVTLFDAAAGVDVPVARRRAGYVFQDTRLFPHLSVRANLLYGAADDSGLAATAALLELTPLLARKPATLSGGEARRVAIGRALLMRPAFLLLDEPTVSLDAGRREEVLRAVERVRDAAGAPVLMVTHDAAEAARVGEVITLHSA
ncbi:ATP-binding cassette domain-containing protein [Sphingomonas sp.]|uniref:ATP-binding cassette domain-containing protein n=1 Tax=Sphingomonas sp. TaxID=28214 RepID=UPI003CC5DD9C